jgi:hypothetical protein
MLYRVVLVGPRAGQTVYLGDTQLRKTGFQFTNGVYEFVEDASKAGPILEMLKNFYGAYPEGPEADAARKAYEEAKPKGRKAPRAPHDARPDVQVHGGEGKAAAGDGHAPAEAGAAGSASDGPSDQSAEDTLKRVQEALLELDPANSTHWTADGRPALSIVSQLAGRNNLTRAVVNAANPGFNRGMALPKQV